MYESEEDLKREYLFCGAAAAHGQERGGFLARGVCHGLSKLTGCDLDEALLRPPLRRDPFAAVGTGWILNVSRKTVCPFGGARLRPVSPLHLVLILER